MSNVCHMYQNGASTTTRVVALTLLIAAATANVKRSSVDDKSFNATHVCSGLIILRFSPRPSDFRTYYSRTCYLVDMFSPPKFNVVVKYMFCLVVCYVWKKAYGKR